MKLLRELIETEQAQTEYVPLLTNKKSIRSKKSKRSLDLYPTSDKTENSLINNLWFYNNADAS